VSYFSKKVEQRRSRYLSCRTRGPRFVLLVPRELRPLVVRFAFIRVNCCCCSQLSVDWSDDGLLGVGAYGDVRSASQRGLQCVVKLMRVDDESLRRDVTEAMLHEARALHQVNHPCVVRLLRVVTDVEATDSRGRPVSPCIVMEHVANSAPLSAVLRPLMVTNPARLAIATRLRARLQATPVAARVHVLAQVARAVAAVHEAGLTHGDLKCDNVLVQCELGEWQTRLLDFGLSRREGEGRGGTRAYMAPELLHSDDADADG
jgi:serine/threonine protein kinase